MKENKIIAVVIPCFRVSKHIKTVIASVPDFIDHIILVDDACPEQSGKIGSKTSHSKLSVIFHDVNQGVGGAVISGFKKAIDLNCDVIVKLDGDGQMDSSKITNLIAPILEEEADYTKGNRFHDFKALKLMPRTRLFGNSVLSFATKLASGYWNVMDPTNGFCAISKFTLLQLNLNKIEKRYFFETDILINLNMVNAVVKDIPLPAIYNDEVSNLSIRRVLLSFPPKILKGIAKRIFYKYYIYNFNMASIYFLMSIPLLLFGFGFGVYKWNTGMAINTENNAGTIMLAALPIILGVQFLLQAIQIDINTIPKKN
ncbi:glycosyltransferase family 2 protein [uncultured Winogradskyella sp.]|uniref:glycosyltransferase family 2 protein n=1 Tax=uncultured Winogradskyella sp. TaxID=395353 RepID=UPI0025FE84E0|nr:glycosyltransferase family 2 protein [uncultured Winogradskyella sp.]